MTNKFKRFIADCDGYFGAPVSVKFDGKSKYKTTFGGLVAIFATIFFLLFAVERLIRLLLVLNPIQSQHSVYHNLRLDVGSNSAESLGLDFAVVAYDKETGSPIELDENYIILSAHSYEISADGMKFNQLTMEPCTGDDFAYANNRGNFDDLPAKCFDTAKAKISGILNNEEFEGVWITVLQCDDESEETYCKN